MKTHVAIGTFAAFFLLSHVTQNQILFISVTIIASLIPDIDSAFSTMGKKKIFKLIQILTSHRGLLHSFTFCLLVATLLAFYAPAYALPFFLGYGLHLFADSFTVDGIQPFWPLKNRSSGILRVGGPLEEVLFVTFCVLTLVAIVLLFV